MLCICTDTLHLSPIYRGYIYLLPALHKTESRRGSLNNSNAAFVHLRNGCARIVLPVSHKEFMNMCDRGAESVFIFGPGEAKGELRKHFHKQNLCERIVGFETADKMTDRQVAQKVRNFYAAAPAIPLANGDQLKQSQEQPDQNPAIAR